MYYEIAYKLNGRTDLINTTTSSMEKVQSLIGQLQGKGFITYIGKFGSKDEMLSQESIVRTELNVFFYNSAKRSVYYDKVTDFEQMSIDLVFDDVISSDFISNTYKKIKQDIVTKGYCAKEDDIKRAVARSAYFIGLGGCMTYINETDVYYVIERLDFVWKIRLTKDRSHQREFTYSNSRHIDRNDYDFNK